MRTSAGGAVKKTDSSIFWDKCVSLVNQLSDFHISETLFKSKCNRLTFDIADFQLIHNKISVVIV